MIFINENKAGLEKCVPIHNVQCHTPVIMLEIDHVKEISRGHKSVIFINVCIVSIKY